MTSMFFLHSKTDFDGQNLHISKIQVWETHHASVNGQPSFGLKLLRYLGQEPMIGFPCKLNIDKDLVACLVMWSDLYVSDILWLHVIDVNVHYIQMLDRHGFFRGLRVLYVDGRGLLTLFFELLKPCLRFLGGHPVADWVLSLKLSLSLPPRE